MSKALLLWQVGLIANVKLHFFQCSITMCQGDPIWKRPSMESNGKLPTRRHQIMEPLLPLWMHPYVCSASTADTYGCIHRGNGGSIVWCRLVGNFPFDSIEGLWPTLLFLTTFHSCASSKPYAAMLRPSDLLPMKTAVDLWSNINARELPSLHIPSLFRTLLI